MQDFSNSVASNRVRQDLLNAIHGQVHSGISRTALGGRLSQLGLNSAPNR